MLCDSDSEAQAIGLSDGAIRVRLARDSRLGACAESESLADATGVVEM